jgi:hypothetical protein
MTPETRKRPYPAKGRPLALNPPMKQPAQCRVTSSSSALWGMGDPSTTMQNRGSPRDRRSSI